MAPTTSDRIDKLTADDYVAAFQKAALSEVERRLLWTHLRSPNYRITARELSKKMGYVRWTGTNLQYGKLAKRIADLLQIHPEPASLNILVAFKERAHGDALLTLRPPVVSALRRLDDGARATNRSVRGKSYSELSPSDAGGVVRQFLPEENLRPLLQAVANSVQIAHQAAKEKWGLRLNQDSIMLKVGFVEVLQIFDGWFHELVEETSIPSRVEG